MNWRRVKECLTVWRVDTASVSDLKSAQVIVTQCAELLKDDKPGQGNILIAEHADKLRRNLGLPIIAQREILVAKPDLETIGIVGGVTDGGSAQKPANTYEVCLAQKKICDEKGWKNVLVVTFPDHMWRACEVYKRLGLNPIPAVMMGSPSIYYEKQAQRWQLRTRSKFKYFWEIPARLLFLKRDWM